MENATLEIKEEHHVSHIVQENPVVELVAEPVVDTTTIVDITNLIQQIETEANTSASIDNSLIDKAATKIQSTYRGYKTRSDFKKQKIINGQVIEIQASSIVEFSVDVSEDKPTESQSLDNSVSQSQQIPTESQQALDVTASQDQQETARTLPLDVDTSKLIDEAISLINSNNQSIDLNDAATKIQSTYRGYKIRKDFVTNKNAISQSKVEATTTISSIPLDSSSSNFSSSPTSNNNNNHMNDDDNDDNNNTNDNNASNNSPTNNDKVLSKKHKKSKKKQNKKH